MDRLDPALATLRSEVETDLVAAHPHVAAPEGREPVRTILLRVCLGPDPEEAEVQEPHGAGERPFAGQTARGDIASAHLPHRGKAPSQPEDAVEFLAAAASAPILVIQVLLPPGRVGAHRLEMAAFDRTDPHVRPGGRDRQRTDPLECRVIGDLLPVRMDVDKPSPLPHPRDARSGGSNAFERTHRSRPSPARSSNLTSTCSSGRARSSST